MTDTEIIKASQAICDALSAEEDGLKRDVLGHLGNTWSLLIIQMLGVNGKLRFSRLQEQVKGISQKMLTKSLRDLERDGLITRTMFLEVPPRVEYELTELGRGLLIQILPLWTWVLDQSEDFKMARSIFDEKAKKQL